MVAPVTTHSGAGRASGIQSVHRALDALEAIGQTPGIGVTALAKRMGVAVSTAHGIATTLAARHYVLHVRGAYDLGPSVAALAQNWDATRSLAVILEPVMSDLSESTGMASTATILVGDVAQIVTYVPAPGPITVRAGSPRRDPLTLSTGRVLIALKDEREWTRFLSASPGAEHGWDADRWRHEFLTIRSAGLAVKTTRDPRLEVSMAVPVFGPGGSLACAVGCSTPSFLAEDLYNHEVLSQLLHARKRLAEMLGGAPGPRPKVDFAAYGHPMASAQAPTSSPSHSKGASA